MRVATLFLQKSGEKDDIIHFDRLASDPDRIRVTYRDGSSILNRGYTFHVSQSGAIQYVGDLLFGLRHDMDPFDCVQVMTATMPSILYHIVDLDDPDIRANIRSTLEGACTLRVNVVTF